MVIIGYELLERWIGNVWYYLVICLVRSYVVFFYDSYLFGCFGEVVCFEGIWWWCEFIDGWGVNSDIRYEGG